MNSPQNPPPPLVTSSHQTPLSVAQKMWLLRIGLILLWLVLGALWGVQFGRIAIDHQRVAILDPLMGLLGETKTSAGSFYGYWNTAYLRALLKLIVVLSVGGGAFWFVRSVSKGTELTYHAFLLLLWIGLLAFCPLPRSIQESAGIHELVHTRSAYAIVGDGFSSIFRNYPVPFVLACIGATATLVRAAKVLLERRAAK
jgi:hypothetical protein